MPAPIENIELGVRGLVFDALAAGPDGGELVLLLHGFPQTSRCWRSQLEALGSAGYRAVAPDQRGYSPGARPEPVEAYRRHELVDDILAMADHLGAERFHVVGHDWGAVVVWQLAGRHPDRLLTAAPISVPHPMAFATALASADADQASRSGYVEMFRADGSEDGMLDNDAIGLRLIYLAAGLSDDEAQPYLDHLGNRETLRAALNWYRSAELGDVEGLGPITTPTLYIWSTNDPALGREGADATGRFVDGPYRYEVLEGVDHWVPEHAADDVNRLLLEHLATLAS